MSGPDEMEAVRASLRREGLCGVQAAFAWDGGQDLVKEGLGLRRRTRLTVAGEDGRRHVLYLKRYGPQGVAAALGRWLRHGRRGSPAAIEAGNIAAARAAGVPTMQVVEWGQEPCPIGARRSYLVVSAAPGEALERCMDAFLARHASDGRLELLTSRLAQLIRTLHGSGHIHRDLYASHVFLEDSADGPELCLIDLARMFRPRWRPMRWRVKDLAQLKYSLPPAWSATQWRPFLQAYLHGAAADELGRWERAVDRKVASIRRHEQRRRRRQGRDVLPRHGPPS